MTFADRIVPALDALAADLTAAGVPTNLDRGKVSTPGAWLTAQSVQTVYLDGSGTIRAHLFLIAPPAQDDRTVLRTLAGLLERAFPILSIADDEGAQDLSYSVSLPHSPTSTFPAWRLLVDVDL